MSNVEIKLDEIDAMCLPISPKMIFIGHVKADVPFLVRAAAVAAAAKRSVQAATVQVGRLHGLALTRTIRVVILRIVLTTSPPLPTHAAPQISIDHGHCLGRVCDRGHV